MNSLNYYKNNRKNTLKRIVAIDILKAISIMMIIITHTITNELHYKVAGPFWIDMAVPIFMILSGFNYSLSLEKKNIINLKEWFSTDNIIPKFIRILFPYFIAISVEIIVYSSFAPKSPIDILKGILTGGWGPGSYYVPILMQLLLIFPILFVAFKRSSIFGLILSISIHLLFDTLSNLIPIANWVYRLVIFRYFGFIIMGIFLFYNRKK